MSILVKPVSTGDTIVFDKTTRDLVVVDKQYVGEIDPAKIQSISDVSGLVAAGKAHKFSKGQLESIQAALVGVVLLV